MKDPRLAQLAPVFSRRQALAAGVTRHEIEWALRCGRWLALRRAAYCERSVFEAADPVERHLLHSRAAVLTHDERHVLSHLSAALTFGLPAPLDDLGRPSLTIGGYPASTDRQADLVVQVAALRDVDVTTWHGFRRTSLSRTVADCLRHLPPLASVPIADAALHRGQTHHTQLWETLCWQEGWPYHAHAMGALALVDGRRESWLESYSFVALHSAGIELPTPQVEVYDASGALVARVDGLWRTHATCLAPGLVEARN